MVPKASSIVFILLFSMSLLTPSPDAALYESASTCRECHQEIYERWTGSGHARSLSGSPFFESLERVDRTMPGYREFCLYCHAPSWSSFKSRMLSVPLAQEGVTCDFCHTTRAVRITDEFPRYLNRPGTKKGPIEGAVSPHHGTEYSFALLESKMCAGCHEYENHHGTPIITTGSEWRESIYCAEGVQCQHCHLRKPFREVTLYRKRLAHDAPPDHGMKGGHQPQLLRDAFKVAGYIVVADDRALVTGEVFNDKAGHMLPTGMPNHKIGLAAQLFDSGGTRMGKEEIFFERSLANEMGSLVTSPEEMFLTARRVARDTRIAPKEKRPFAFAFPVMEHPGFMHATLSLFYELPPSDLFPGGERIQFAVITIPYERFPFPWGAVISLLVLVTSGIAAYVVFSLFLKRWKF